MVILLLWPQILNAEDPLSGRPVDHWYVPYLGAAIVYTAFSRAFWLYGDAHVGRAPDSAEVGDRIMIFLGGTIPILLRSSASGCVVVGEAYVDDMMDVEAFREPEVEMEPITLV